MPKRKAHPLQDCECGALKRRALRERALSPRPRRSFELEMSLEREFELFVEGRVASADGRRDGPVSEHHGRCFVDDTEDEPAARLSSDDDDDESARAASLEHQSFCDQQCIDVNFQRASKKQARCEHVKAGVHDQEPPLMQTKYDDIEIEQLMRLAREHWKPGCSTETMKQIHPAFYDHFHRKFDRLTRFQTDLYWSCFNDIGVWLEKAITYKSLGGLSIMTWHDMIVRLVKKVVDPSDNYKFKPKKDCWLVRGRTRPHSKMCAFNIEYEYDQNGSEHWKVKQDPERTISCYASRFACLIRNGPSSDYGEVTRESGLVGSHLCWDATQRCINPHHIVWETAAGNDSRLRRCRTDVLNCPHMPRCIHTTENGQYIKCLQKSKYYRRCQCLVRHSLERFPASVNARECQLGRYGPDRGRRLRGRLVA